MRLSSVKVKCKGTSALRIGHLFTRVSVSVLFLMGCGSIGPPLPPLLNIPKRSNDLRVQQTTQGIVFAWTWPALTTEGMPLRDLDSFVVHGIEIISPDQIPSREYFEHNSSPFVLLEGSALEPFAPGEEVRVVIPTMPLVGKTLAFGVRGSSSRGRTLGFSDLVVINVVDGPGSPGVPIVSIEQDAIIIEWEAADRASFYRVFRGSKPGGVSDEIGRTQETSLEDFDFEWNQHYSYRVRSFRQSVTGEVEGPLSAIGDIFTLDRFPPSLPLGLRAVVTEKGVELSWQPNSKKDFAGFRVWRAEVSGDPVALNADLLRLPAYSDQAIERGETYHYSVSAVDQAGNESKLSESLKVSLW